MSNVVVSKMQDILDMVNEIYGEGTQVQSVKSFEHNLETFNRFFDKKFEYFVEEINGEFYMIKKRKVYGEPLTIEGLILESYKKK